MQNRKWYEWLLTLTYIAMIALCVGLNLTTGQKEGTANIIVNVVMFVIVGLIFLSCERNAFMPINEIIEDLEEASEKIRNDAMNSHQFLWEPYNRSKVELFQEPRLRQLFQDRIANLYLSAVYKGKLIGRGYRNQVSCSFFRGMHLEARTFLKVMLFRSGKSLYYWISHLMKTM